MSIWWRITEKGKREYTCVCGSPMKLHKAGALVCTDPKCWWIWDFTHGWGNGKENARTLNKWIPIQKTEYAEYIAGHIQVKSSKV
jgi:hypothetical protein